LGFKGNPTAVRKTGVESGAVIKSFDVVEDSAASLGKGGEALVVDQLIFKTAPEGFDEGVIGRRLAETPRGMAAQLINLAVQDQPMPRKARAEFPGAVCRLLATLGQTCERKGAAKRSFGDNCIPKCNPPFGNEGRTGDASTQRGGYRRGRSIKSCRAAGNFLYS
jgi:hypothetical protein